MMRGLSTRNYGAVVKDFHRRRKVRGERKLHRGQPREGQAVNGASAGPVAALRGVNRGHSVQGPADDRSAWYWLRWNENRTGHPRRRDGKHGGGERTAEPVGGTRIGLLDTADVCPGWRQSTGCSGAETCGRGCVYPALP